MLLVPSKFLSTLSQGNDSSDARAKAEQVWQKFESDESKGATSLHAISKKKAISSTGADGTSIKIAEAGPKDPNVSAATKMSKLMENIGTVAVKSGSVPDAGIIFIVQKLKEALQSYGAHGFIGLQRKFRIMDDDGSKTLTVSEFKKGMKEMNMGLTDGQLRALFDFFDQDHSGCISFDEFIQGVRDPLSERCLRLVRMAFSKLDKNGNGIVDSAEIAKTYDASKHPEVIAGRKTANSVLNEFLETFDVGGVVDGKVTQDEFINYYANIGASVDNDEYFELMIRNAWHISGGEGAAANSANRRVLLRMQLVTSL